jgi:4-carboxymuconolactone decarboxylase
MKAQSNSNNSETLDVKQQSIVSVSALTATGNIPELNMGMNTGLTESQLLQLFNVIEKTIGKQQADTAKEVWSKVKTSKES